MSESKAAGNIGDAVRLTIPEIGPGNLGKILSGCVENEALMILPLGTSFLSTREGSWNASARFHLMRGNCGRRHLEDNPALILTAGGSDWLIETELQNRFRPDFRFGFGILTADDGKAGFSGWGRKMGYGHCQLVLCIINVQVKMSRKYMKIQ